MIYVYIKNWGIIKKSKDIVNWLSYDSVEQVDYKLTDKLIYEKGKIVKYEDSELYKKDKWILWVAEERDKLKEELKKKEGREEKGRVMVMEGICKGYGSVCVRARVHSCGTFSVFRGAIFFRSPRPALLG